MDNNWVSTEKAKRPKFHPWQMPRCLYCIWPFFRKTAMHLDYAAAILTPPFLNHEVLWPVSIQFHQVVWKVHILSYLFQIIRDSVFIIYCVSNFSASSFGNWYNSVVLSETTSTFAFPKASLITGRISCRTLKKT